MATIIVLFQGEFPVADLGGFHRFQLKPPFRSLVVLTYSSIPVSLRMIRHASAEITMAFKLQVLDTADSANIQRLGPDCMCAIKYCGADRAAYFLLVGMLVVVFLSIDYAKMKRKQTCLITFLAEKVYQGKAIYVY